MAGLLLDTNVLIALLNGRVESLPSGLRAAVTDVDAQLVVSVASFWEIAIKTRLGKLKVRASVGDLPGLIDEMGIALLVIDAPHAVTAADPEPETRDPFDRLLLAQCQVEGFQLMTLDRALAGHRLAWRAR